MARKPLDGTVAHNVTTHGTGAINVDACRVGSESTLRTSNAGTNGDGWRFGVSSNVNGSDAGRWPANIMHDGSPEVLAGFPMTTSESRSAGVRSGMGYMGATGDGGPAITGSTGTAARFYYCAKASRAERERGLTHREPETVGDGRAVAADNAYQRGATQRLNIHPTVKPVSVMRWLVRLVTPPGGTVLDPYAGSGTTGIAATLEGFDFVGCELSHEYADLARGRIAHARANPRQWEPDADPLDEPNEDQLDMFT